MVSTFDLLLYGGTTKGTLQGILLVGHFVDTMDADPGWPTVHTNGNVSKSTAATITKQ